VAALALDQSIGSFIRVRGPIITSIRLVVQTFSSSLIPDRAKEMRGALMDLQRVELFLQSLQMIEAEAKWSGLSGSGSPLDGKYFQSYEHCSRFLAEGEEAGLE